MSLYIPIILGTARNGRRSEHIARHVLAFAKTLEIETELLDVRDFPQSFTQSPNPKMLEWKDKAQRADGFVVVTPEYNHGYPGELKMFIDHVYKECNRKPIGFCGVSDGVLGGARGIEQLRLVSIEFQMIPIRTAVYFRSVMDLLDENNQLKDIDNWNGRLGQLFDELLWYARVLKAERIEWNATRGTKA
jgi:NAD(P)H-dependent FMN reductase